MLVLVLLLAARVGLIDFDDALQLGQIITARLAKPLQQEPRRLLRDADFLGELHGRDALARRDQQVHRVNPLVQRHMRALENRAGANRKVFLAGVAAVVATSARRDPLAKAAHWATNAVRPEATFKVDPGRILVREHLEELESRDGRLAHGIILASGSEIRLQRRGSQVYNSLLLGGRWFAGTPCSSKQ